MLEMILGGAGWIVVLAGALGGVILVAFGVSGQFLLPAAAMLGAAIAEPNPLSWRVILALLAIALAVELLELVLGVWGGRRAGGSRAAALGSLAGGFLGAILGTLVLPVIGSLAGVLAGTFAGAALAEYHQRRDSRGSLRVGTGALLGRSVGIALKGAVSLGFLVVACALAVTQLLA